jgi:hypothetical protein
MSTSEVFSFDTPRMSPRLEISKTAVWGANKSRKRD